MKIGVIISSLTGGGAERVAMNLNDYLNAHRDGVESDLIVLNKTGDYQYEGETIFINKNYNGSNRLRKLLFHKFLYSYYLGRLKEKKEYDMVISFASLSNLMNIRSKRNEFCVVSVRNFASLNLSEEKRAMVKKWYGKADKVVAVSKLCSMDLRENFNIPQKKLDVIYNPYNIPKIHELMEASIGKDSEYFSEGKTLLAVGRLSKQKGFWRLIKVIAVLRETIPDVRLVILGRELNGTSMTRRLTNMIDYYSLHEYVHIIGFRENPYVYMKAADVYVLSSLFEGFPNAMTEAMVTGLPVVSVDCQSGPGEILDPKKPSNVKRKQIEQGEYGILVPQYNHDEEDDIISQSDRDLANAVAMILENETLRYHYAVQASQRGQHFSVDSIADRWLHLKEVGETEERLNEQ